MKTKTINLYSYNELPEIAKRKVRNGLIEDYGQDQFDICVNDLKVASESLTGVAGFDVDYSTSNSQTDYVGISFSLLREKADRRSLIEFADNYPDMVDVLSAYKNLIKRLKVGEKVKVEYRSFVFTVHIIDRDGESGEVGLNYNNVVRFGSGGSLSALQVATVGFIKELRHYCEVALYAALSDIHSDDFVKIYTDGKHYDEYGNEHDS